MRVHLELKTLRRVLALWVAWLVFAGFWVEIWDHVLDYDDPWDLIPFFGLSYEHNLPTWAICTLLLLCSLALALIALARRGEGGRFVRHWWGLSLAFAYISLDELVQLHEQVSTWFHAGGGVLYYSWVVPAAIAVVLLAALYLPFLLHLDGRTRGRFLLAGALYVGGALVMELPLGWWAERAGDDNLVYALIDLVEEGMELSGASFFLYSLVEYLAGPERILQLSFRAGLPAELEAGRAAPRRDAPPHAQERAPSSGVADT